MKWTTFLFTILFLSQLIGFNAALASSIPHYEVYPATPLEDYNNVLLDFYSVRDPYGEFSNFALFPVVIDELEWPTSEHYYQAHKYSDPEMIERVRLTKTPYEAAKLGRDPQFPKRAEWEMVKDDIMEIAVRAKFDQYPILQKLLKQTKSAYLFEHTRLDCYWGDCGDRTGLNKLGNLLMLLRSEMASDPSAE